MERVAAFTRAAAAPKRQQPRSKLAFRKTRYESVTSGQQKHRENNKEACEHFFFFNISTFIFSQKLAADGIFFGPLNIPRQQL